jgi:hypothetical protein
MSIFELNHLCRDAMRDKGLREALRSDPGKALVRYDLSDRERALLLAGDVAALHRLGANAFLLGYLARFELFGLSIARYGERMRAIDPSDAP